MGKIEDRYEELEKQSMKIWKEMFELKEQLNKELTEENKQYLNKWYIIENNPYYEILKLESIEYIQRTSTPNLIGTVVKYDYDSLTITEGYKVYHKKLKDLHEWNTPIEDFIKCSVDELSKKLKC